MVVKLYLDRGRDFVYRVADGYAKGNPAITIHSGYGMLGQGNEKVLRTDFSQGYEIVDGPEPDIPNTAVVKASCGQEMTLELDNIDKNQDISEVTIRGVKYAPA